MEYTLDEDDKIDCLIESISVIKKIASITNKNNI
jgi:hypothetical protein